MSIKPKKKCAKCGEEIWNRKCHAVYCKECSYDVRVEQKRERNKTVRRVR